MNLMKHQIPTTNYSRTGGQKKQYIVLHYTAGLSSKVGSALRTTTGTFSNPSVQASAHYVVDDAGVVEALDPHITEAYTWHCGTRNGYKHKYCRNRNSIGIEMCSNYRNYKGQPYSSLKATDPNWYITEDTLKNTIELVVELMVSFKIPIENVIRHNDVTGKLCPSPYCGTPVKEQEWVKLKNRIKERYDARMGINSKNTDNINTKTPIYETLNDVPEYGKEAIKYYLNKGFMKGCDDKGTLNISNDLLRSLIILYNYIKSKE